MGTSTDAILVFGFQLEDEDATPEFMGDFDDFDEYLDDLNGLVGRDYPTRSAARESCPADMTMHCSYDYPMYILSMRGTATRAWRGTPREIDSLGVDPSKVDEFKAWAAERGIEGEPKWILCSMWG